MARVRRSRVTSIVGTSVARPRRPGRSWRQEECLKKNGRSSVAGEMSYGYAATKASSLAALSRARKTW
jgi:hypothetical protein